MNTELLSAVREGKDFAQVLPCGVSFIVPGEVLQQWAVTPAPDEFRQQATGLLGANGRVSVDFPKATPILEIIMQLLPTLLPICLPLLVNSLSPPKAEPTSVVPVTVPR